MTSAGTHSCAGCAELQQQLEQVQAQLVQVQADLAAARKNSSNSSKPPSSDFVKKPKDKPKGGGKRKRGGQRGHKKHERPLLADDQVADCIDYCYLECPDCGGPVKQSTKPPRVMQQVDVPAELIRIVEHRSQACWCSKCQQVHYAPIDPEVRRAGLIGQRLTAWVAFLKGPCHCSFSTVRKFIRDVVGLTVSRGYLAKIIAKVSASLKDSYAELEQLVRQQSALNVDETGHKDYSDAMWTWCFRASLFTLFKIDKSRGSDVLLKVLGEEFDGILGCDYFSAYRKYMKDCSILVQFCLAHFLRDVRFLVEHPHSRNRAYGRRVLERLRGLFAVIHDRDNLSTTAFASRLQNAGDELYAEVLNRVPNTKEAQNLAHRFAEHGDSYLRFITTPGIEPTNNLAEQAIRFVVIDRKVTQGSRGTIGQRWLERIWTVVATCAQTGRNLFAFLHDSIKAHFQGQPSPSLLPNTS